MLFDGSFCVSVLGIKWPYDSSYCLHFIWKGWQTFMCFLFNTYLYIPPIWHVNKQYLFDWVALRRCIGLTIVWTFCSASQDLNTCSYNICKVMKASLQYLFWLSDSQNTYFDSMFTTDTYLWHFLEIFSLLHVLIFEI